jgi:hypothetical protein
MRSDFLTKIPRSTQKIRINNKFWWWCVMVGACVLKNMLLYSTICFSVSVNEVL